MTKKLLTAKKTNTVEVWAVGRGCYCFHRAIDCSLESSII